MPHSSHASARRTISARRIKSKRAWLGGCVTQPAWACTPTGSVSAEVFIPHLGMRLDVIGRHLDAMPHRAGCRLPPGPAALPQCRSATFPDNQPSGSYSRVRLSAKMGNHKPGFSCLTFLCLTFLLAGLKGS